jgi:hypothetical protein
VVQNIAFPVGMAEVADRVMVMAFYKPIAGRKPQLDLPGGVA